MNERQTPQITPPPENQQQPIVTPQPTQEPILKEKPNRWLIIVLAAFALVALGIAGAFTYQNYQLKNQVSRAQSTPTPSNLPTDTPKAVSDKQTYNSILGYGFEYPQDWQTSNFVVKKGETKRRPDRSDINATQGDIEVIEISKGDWIIEVQASSTPKTDSCGYQGPIYGETLKQYRPLNILNHQVARFDLENGYYWQGADRPESYPQPIMFQKPLSNDLKKKLNIKGEAYNYHWCTENQNNTLQLSFVYYSDSFTKNNITTGILDTQALVQMDQILSSFKFLDATTNNKEQILQAVNNYLTGLIKGDRETAIQYLTEGVKPDVPTSWPEYHQIFRKYEILNEFHSPEEERQFYKQDEVIFDVKFYKENDIEGNKATLMFVKENGSWKTLSWYLFP